MSENCLMDAHEVAEMLGVTTEWVYGRSRSGDIPTVKLGRYKKYRRDAILAWIELQEA